MNSNLPNPPCVLCGTDFSDRSRHAALVAAKLAARTSEMLVLAHVTQSADKDVLKLANDRLQEQVNQIPRNGAPIESVLLTETPAGSALLSFANRKKPTLIVLSSGTKGPIDRWAFGSVSEQIAESAPVPTLVVHDATPLETWDWAGSTLKVLVAVDFYASSDGVLRWVRELRRVAPCDIVVCHVNWRPWARTGDEHAKSATEPTNPPDVQERLERALRKKIRDQLGDEGGAVIIRPTYGEAETAIIQVAKEIKADLIVVGAHQRHGISRLLHGSVSRGLLHRAPTNVACVPTKAAFDPREAHIPEYRRVLVATDFSEVGNAAVPFACGACAIGGLVEIVHVNSPERSAGKRPQPAQLLEQLRRLIPDEIGARAQPPELQILEDPDPANAICREADRFGADLVCLASHGLSGSKALFGSVTQAVLKNIRRPILIVRRPEE